MLEIILKFISRNPKKAMGYIRDIAVPIILLLTVGAIFVSLNNQISYLFGLADSGETILIRATDNEQIENSIPYELINDLKKLNVEFIIPVSYQTIHINYTANQQPQNASITVIFTNLSLITQLRTVSSVSSSLIESFTSSDVIIGSILEKNLGLEFKDKPYNLSFLDQANSSVTVQTKLRQPDNYQQYLLVDFSSEFYQKYYNEGKFSELIVKPISTNQLTSLNEEIQSVLLENYPTCSCNVIVGSGSSSLISIVLTKLTRNLDIFFAILQFLIIIRLIQALLWLEKDFRYEINLLKILGLNRLQVFTLFVLIGLVFGNLSILLSFVGIIIIPPIIALLISLTTLNSTLLTVPSEIQILETIFILNFIFLISSLYPALKIANSKIISPKTREI